MYLGGALERARVESRRRLLVVCPSGIATAWMLVASIETEFPEVELVKVLSGREYEAQNNGSYDLVVSTIALTEYDAPVVVVSALLSESDVSRVAAHL